MKKERWIEEDELKYFEENFNTPGKRAAWIRNELNMIYPGMYTPPKVADQCKVITAQGLRKLESENDARPRNATLISLSEFYNISLTVLTDESPQRFYLGKPQTEIKTADIRGPLYKLNIVATLTRPDGGTEEHPLISDLSLRHIDFEQACDLFRFMEGWIKSGVDKQQRLDKAYDVYRGHS